MPVVLAIIAFFILFMIFPELGCGVLVVLAMVGCLDVAGLL